jgi:hypothetical protein
MPQIPVTICVAMSKSGRFLVAITDSNWFQEEAKHKDLLKQVREDKQLWSVKYIKTTVPYPMSREDVE